ncbi:MAG: spore germination protein [Firmicutes bacterium]|nr:spore germination protein [Bacillota bacterium]
MKIIDELMESFRDCPDFIAREVVLTSGKTGYLLFLETLIEPEWVRQRFLEPLLALDFSAVSASAFPESNLVGICPIDSPDVDSLKNAVLSGSAILLTAEERLALTGYPAGKNHRDPHDSFVKELHANLGLLRRRIASSNLKFKVLEIGRFSPGKVGVAYLEGAVQPGLLAELTGRIERLKVDGVVGTGQMERLVRDFPWSPFPQFQAAERPDKAIAALLAGKLLLILDGDPVTLIAPATFFDFFQEPDDLNGNGFTGAFSRWLRLLAVGLGIFFPAMYVAVMAYHYYIVPLHFLAVLAESRVRVPFPPVIEVLIIEAVVELLRELASRLPHYIGVITGVVAGVLLGLAAVFTGAVSGFLIIVSMATLIASLVLPADLISSVRMLKFATIFATALFGVLGLVVTASVIFAHLVTMESLGRPYFQPVIPFQPSGFKGVFIRTPCSHMQKRMPQPQSKRERRGAIDGAE